MADSTAREQDLTDQQARAHFAVGRALYDSGRFAEAAGEFQQAYDLSRRPTLLYNLYIAYRDSSQPVRARDALRQYLAEVPDVPNRAHLEARLAALDVQVSEQERAEAERARAEEQRREAEAAREAAEARLAARSRARPWWPWLLVGAGAAAIGAGVGVGIDAENRASVIRGLCGSGPSCGNYAPARGGNPPVDDVGGVLAQAAIADVLWIGGAILAGTGLVLAFQLDDDVSEQVPGASVACGPSGCAVSLSGSF